MRRIVIAGAGSHCGKTTVTCGLLASLRNRGVSVSAYKTGPDYIDPQYLREAGRCEAYNLDTWLMSPEKVKELFVKTSLTKDIAVIEGAMGLFDGGAESTAGIAKLLDAPVVLVLDVRALGESAAAVALGFREFDRDVHLAGVILNNTGSDYHVKIIAESLAEKGIKFLGALRRDDGLAVPERHLGLALEHRGSKLERVRLAVEGSVDLEEIVRTAGEAGRLHAEVHTLTPIVRGVRIGVAMDEAFSFYYPESLAVLEELGAEVAAFSPLKDERLLDADGYIFGGGFPEMFAEELSENVPMLESVRANRRPVLAECGGMMYLCRSLADLEGRTWPMAGVIPFEAKMTSRAVLGYMEAEALRTNILCGEGERLRGHEFHYSRVEPEYREGSCAFRLTRRNTGGSRLGGYADDGVLASYLHVNFWGNIEAAQKFISSCIDIKHSSIT